MDSSIATQLNTYINDPLALKNAYDELKHWIEDDSFISLANLIKTSRAFEKRKVSTAYFAGLALK